MAADQTESAASKQSQGAYLSSSGPAARELSMPTSRRTAAAVVGTALALATAPALAAEPAPTVTVTSEGGAGFIKAVEDIDAPRQTVWDIMVDCARVPKMMASVKYCRVLQRDPAGRWDIREQVTQATILPGARVVMHSEYDAPHTVEFHRTDGDFKILEGEWRLEPLDGGARTRLFYQTRVSSPVPAPGFLVRALLRTDMTESLQNLRTTSEAAARAQAANGPARP